MLKVEIVFTLFFIRTVDVLLSVLTFVCLFACFVLLLEGPRVQRQQGLQEPSTGLCMRSPWLSSSSRETCRYLAASPVVSLAVNKLHKLLISPSSFFFNSFSCHKSHIVTVFNSGLTQS